MSIMVMEINGKNGRNGGFAGVLPDSEWGVLKKSMAIVMVCGKMSAMPWMAEMAVMDGYRMVRNGRERYYLPIKNETLPLTYPCFWGSLR